MLSPPRMIGATPEYSHVIGVQLVDIAAFTFSTFSCMRLGQSNNTEKKNMRCDAHSESVFMVFFDPHSDKVDDGW